MRSQIIVMLTHNDQTVLNAMDTFQTCADLPIENWGFKDIGLEKSKMYNLVNVMKESKKKTFLEIVSYSEKDCMDGAKLAVDMGFDYLMGTVFHENVFEFLSKQSIQYLPFCGKVHGNPSILEGTFDEIISNAESMLARNIFGIDLLAFRHANGADLAKTFCQAIKKPVVIAGSINSFNRIDFVNSINPWGFTIGSAIFDKKFSPTEDFRGNLVKVHEYMNSLNN